MSTVGEGLGMEGCRYHTQSDTGTQLVWAIMCGTYLIFLIIQMPRVNWETVVVPLVELLCYLMRWSGNGYVQLGVNVYMPWVMYSSWVMTTPALLFQIQDIVDIKIHKLRMAPLQTLLNVLMMMSGITASLISSNGFKLLFYALGCIFHILILIMSCFHFNEGIRRFQESKIEIVTSWTAYPVLWLLSSQGLCIVADNILDECYLVADVLSKAIFGLTMWHTKTKILKGHWEIARYIERKKNKIHYKLLGNAHKEPDYGEDEVEDIALQRRRRVHMSNAQQCFQLADACIRQAELCLEQANNSNNELLRNAFVGDHYLRQVTPLYQRIEQGAREWKVLGRTHDQRREKYMFPIKRELKRHPMKPILLECVDDISFPMPFNQADSTLEEEAEEETLKFGRSASDANMDTVLPTLQQSVARFGLHQRQRNGLSSAPSFDIKTAQRSLTDSVSSDRSQLSGPVVGRHLGDDVPFRMPSSRRRAESGSADKDAHKMLLERNPAILRIIRELGPVSGSDPSELSSSVISSLRNSVQQRRSEVSQPSKSKRSRSARKKEAATAAGAAAATSAGSPSAQRGGDTVDDRGDKGGADFAAESSEVTWAGVGEWDQDGHDNADFEVVIDIQREIERVNAMLNSGGESANDAGEQTIHQIQQQISAVNAMLATIDTNPVPEEAAKIRL